MKFVLTLALAAALVPLAPAFAAPAPKNPLASPELQKEFNGFIEKFRAALKANDSAAVASMTQLPFMATVPDAAQFRAKTYPKTFTAKVRTCVQRSKPVYDRDQLNNDYFSIFCGDDIFIFTKTPAGFLFTDVSVND